MFACRIEADSITAKDHAHCHYPMDDPAREETRLTTFVITLPRVVLAEIVTHRLNKDSWGYEETSICERTTDESISKNSSSSRAIPFSRLLQATLQDPYMPRWTRNQGGMQGDLMTQDEGKLADDIWRSAMMQMVHMAQQLNKEGVHKQDCNRLLEPWSWVTQVITSAHWDNYFALRCDNMAHPAIRHIARLMFLARRNSAPKRLEFGQWHLPFVPADQVSGFNWQPEFAIKDPYPGHVALTSKIPDLLKASVARCAWVSYCNHDQDGTQEQVDRTWERLVGSKPRHASPLEHQATPLFRYSSWVNLRSNLTGWLQLRKLLPEERVDSYNPSEEEIKSWNMDEFA